jgi:hypothetical protein
MRNKKFKPKQEVSALLIFVFSLRRMMIHWREAGEKRIFEMIYSERQPHGSAAFRKEKTFPHSISVDYSAREDGTLMCRSF